MYLVLTFVRYFDFVIAANFINEESTKASFPPFDNGVVWLYFPDMS